MKERIFPLLHKFVTKSSVFQRVAFRCYVGGTTERGALATIVALHKRGTGIISDLLGEEVTSEGKAREVALTCIKHMVNLDQLRQTYPTMELAIATKLTNLGLKIDTRLATHFFQRVYAAGAFYQIRLENDIEGLETIPAAMSVISELGKERFRFRQAIAANQTASGGLLKVCIQHNLGVRIVKGAYLGDITGREKINKNFVDLARKAREAGLDVAIGTQDTKLLEELPFATHQALFGVRPFYPARWRYMPWALTREDARGYLLRRYGEGLQPNLIHLFLRNVGEALLWRALYVRKIDKP